MNSNLQAIEELRSDVHEGIAAQMQQMDALKKNYAQSGDMLQDDIAKLEQSLEANAARSSRDVQRLYKLYARTRKMTRLLSAGELEELRLNRELSLHLGNLLGNYRSCCSRRMNLARGCARVPPAVRKAEVRITSTLLDLVRLAQLRHPVVSAGYLLKLIYRVFH